jgi:hypothetical protein
MSWRSLTPTLPLINLELVLYHVGDLLVLLAEVAEHSGVYPVEVLNNLFECGDVDTQGSYEAGAELVGPNF